MWQMRKPSSVEAANWPKVTWNEMAWQGFQSDLMFTQDLAIFHPQGHPHPILVPPYLWTLQSNMLSYTTKLPSHWPFPSHRTRRRSWKTNKAMVWLFSRREMDSDLGSDSKAGNFFYLLSIPSESLHCMAHSSQWLSFEGMKESEINQWSRRDIDINGIFWASPEIKTT